MSVVGAELNTEPATRSWFRNVSSLLAVATATELTHWVFTFEHEQGLLANPWSEDRSGLAGCLQEGGYKKCN